MESHLPNAVEAGRYRAKKAATYKSKRICLHIEGEVIPIEEFYEDGFAIFKAYKLPNRAIVEVHDGPALLFHGMIHYAAEENELQHFEFKRLNQPVNEAPKDYSEIEVEIAGFISTK